MLKLNLSYKIQQGTKKSLKAYTQPFDKLPMVLTFKD